jgi:RimJ/RimL family protein N-acetyltransferase
MESARLKLEILAASHLPQIFDELGTDPEIYRWLTFTAPRVISDLSGVLTGFINETDIGLRVAYAVVLKSTDLAIGTTSFLDLNPTNHSLEIGSSFYARKYWRTFVNTDCKLLMLTEAFEVRMVERVTLKTDAMNERSRTAIARLGATFEGVLRHHMKRPDGSWRDSAFYSILRPEWPALKEKLSIVGDD